MFDQNGNLLSTQNANNQDKGFDAKQLQYIQELEENYIRRIETILAPITGAANVRAQVTADLDFPELSALKKSIVLIITSQKRLLFAVNKHSKLLQRVQRLMAESLVH